MWKCGCIYEILEEQCSFVFLFLDKIQIISMGKNLISFSPKDSSMYLAVDKNGNMFLTVSIFHHSLGI